MAKGNSEKKDFIDSLIPNPLKAYLKDSRYMCVGGSLFKASAKKLGGGYVLDFIEISKDYLKETKGTKYPSSVYKEYGYDSDSPIPCNIRDDYEFVVKGTIWNSYNYPAHDHKEIRDEDELRKRCPATVRLFEHIYRDDLILGLDYATVELMNPEQKLPVQVLYSKENKTAKSTILNQRKYMYGQNGAIIDSATFEDKFNAPVVGKNFVGIDEGKLKNEDSMEKIKMRVTSPTIPYREMRKSAKDVPNFGKWFLATNKENFAKLDEEDSRFWMIQCYKLKDKYDSKFDDKLKAEAPYWIGFLKYRWDNRFNKTMSGMFKMNNPKSLDRLWFPEDKYSTAALARVKRFSKSKACKELLMEIIEWFHVRNNRATSEGRKEVTKVHATAKMLRIHLIDLDKKISALDIKRILENEVNLRVCTSDGKIENKTFLNYFKEKQDGTPSSDRNRNVFEINYHDMIKIIDGEDAVVDENGLNPEQLKINHKK